MGMDAGPIKSHAKPEQFFSGFFITVLLFLSPARGQPPSELLEELLGGRDISCPGSADSATVPMRVIVTSAYHDLYFKQISDTGAAGRVKEKTALRRPSLHAELFLDRATWGVTVQGQAGTIRSQRHSSADNYDYSIDAPFNAMAGGGWLKTGRLRLSGMLGYDKGLSTVYSIDGSEYATDKLRAIPADPRFMHALTATCSMTSLHVGLYEKKQPLLSALGRIENTSSHNAIELPVAAADQEYGAFSTFRMGQDSCGMAMGYAQTSSDTGPALNSALPVKIAGSGWHCRIAAAATSIPLSPWLCIAWRSREMQLRGYDGNAPEPYCYLDSNRLIHTCFKTGFGLPWKLECGVFTESAMCHSVLHGRFDPYPFSAFTIFDPVKFRLDTLGIRYRSAGGTIGRAFSASTRDRITTRLTVAWVELEGSLATREYNFSFVIPRLINQRSWSIAHERRLLITPEALYSFRWNGLTCTGLLRQIIPLDIESFGGRGAANSGASAENRSVHGGTTVRVTVEYRL
jgi:hypothetical protein